VAGMSEEEQEQTPLFSIEFEDETVVPLWIDSEGFGTTKRKLQKQAKKLGVSLGDVPENIVILEQPESESE
jgi:hypothetical protein